MELTNDLSQLTSIPQKVLKKLCELSIYCINEEVFESLNDGEPVVEVDIGIGDLLIQLSDNELKFKFIPSDMLKQEVINTIQQHENSMIVKLNYNLVDTITKTYKELI